jgi:twinkle protein
VLAFDNDESGQRYVEEAARLLSPGKAFIAKFPQGHKDACDLLKAGKVAELKQVFWKAVPFSRVDVLHLEQLWEDFESEDNNVKIPFPPSWSHLNEMMNGGMEKGEITVIGALTSIGKSSIINNVVYNLIENTKFKVGAMYLEGTKREVVRDLLSLDAGINLRITGRDSINLEELKQRFFDGLAKKNQFVYVDHQGSISTDEIFDKLNYLAKAEGCDVIIIDPIQAGVNSSDNGAIIQFMDTLLKFAKETDTCVIAVSHMKKPSEDNPHAVSEYQLMGSSSINQIAFNTILISRDKLNECPIKKSATKLQLVKCRRTGNTGEAGWLRYDYATTHMFATSNPYVEQDVTKEEETSMNTTEVVIDF